MCLTRVLVLLAVLGMITNRALADDTVQTETGRVQGKTTADGKVHAFLGIPYAAPPVGDLRWKEPQSAKPWTGVRSATEFGYHCMQGKIFGDMVFPDPGENEDCLTLNVWTANLSANAKLPVMVWIHGGGFQAGAASEPRQNGESLAHKGVVVVSMNYRLGIFGFFAHPQLTKESPHHASGNYGLMDQAAALQWVKRNITAFGGDTENVTIFGESAGSFSVSAQMASPLAKDVVKKAIGESGAFFGRTLHANTLAAAEEDGMKFGSEIRADTLAKLRALPAQQLLDAVMKGNTFRFGTDIDGYFLPASPDELYRKGEQAHVPLLAGWNRDEGTWRAFFGSTPVTKENFIAKVRQDYGEHAAVILRLFPAANESELKQAARHLNTADFIAYGTWKWLEFQKPVAPVFRYEFDQMPPAAADAKEPDAGKVAYHSAEIEYVFGMLDSKHLPWTPADYKLSELMQNYWTNFAKAGDPNGKGLPKWPVYDAKEKYEVIHLQEPRPGAKPDALREMYMAIDKAAERKNQTASVQYPNTSGGLYFFLEEILSATRKGDEQKANELVASTEIPSHRKWLLSIYEKRKAESWIEAYEKELETNEKQLRELFTSLAMDDGEIRVRKVSDEDIQVDQGMERELVHAAKKPVDIYFAIWTPMKATEAHVRPIGYFMFIDGAFRWDSTTRLVTPKTIQTQTAEVQDVACPGGHGKVSGAAYKVADGVSAPKAVRMPDPEYSELARQEKVQGTVKLSFIVDTDGCAKKIQVVQSLGHGLDEQAIEALRRWHFEPGTKDGAPVPVQLGVTMDFRLY